MIFISTSIENIDKNNLIYDVEAYFRLKKNTLIKHPLYETVIREVDGATKIFDDGIRTKFGSTLVDNLSTGCKALIIAVNNPNTWVNFLEAGSNVIEVASKLCKTEIDIHIICEKSFLIKDLNYRVNADGNITTVKDLYLSMGVN